MYQPGNKRFAQLELKFIREEVKRQLKAGIIRENDGPWWPPVTLGLENNGSYRFCVAYVRLNAVTERESWPLPNLEEVLECMGGHKYYTTFDGFSGFKTVPICAEDQDYTTFGTGYRTYCYTIMSFILENAPHTYCRCFQKVFAKQVSHSIKTYMDDCAVMSMGFNTHYADVEESLNLIEQGKMKVNPWKSHFFQRGVKFLGHYVDYSGVSVLRDRIRQIEDWLKPNNVKEVRAFLGFCGYYRRFVRNYSKVAPPLVLLTRQAVKWKWGEYQENAFNDFKDVLSFAPALAPPDNSKPWTVDYDASSDALGAVLSQVCGEGLEHPVYFYSRTFNADERNYSTTDRECLAVVAGMKKFRAYVLGGEILIRTDHSAVRRVLKNTENTGRYARWVSVLSQFDFTLKYRPGEKHSNADGLNHTVPAIHDELEDINDEPWHYALWSEL